MLNSKVKFKSDTTRCVGCDRVHVSQGGEAPQAKSSQVKSSQVRPSCVHDTHAFTSSAVYMAEHTYPHCPVRVSASINQDAAHFRIPLCSSMEQSRGPFLGEASTIRWIEIEKLVITTSQVKSSNGAKRLHSNHPGTPSFSSPNPLRSLSPSSSPTTTTTPTVASFREKTTTVNKSY